MVEVSLLKLVTISATRPAWPEEFAALVNKCEENPAERLPFGAVADWLDEHDEPGLADAFRWLHKRPAVKVTWVEPRYGGDGYFDMSDPPVTMKVAQGSTLAELAGRLVPILAEMRAAFE